MANIVCWSRVHQAPLPNMNLDFVTITKLTFTNLMTTMRNAVILSYSQNHLEIYSDVLIFRVGSNYQRGHTGQMSLITAAMNAAGLVVGLLILKAGIQPGWPNKRRLFTTSLTIPAAGEDIYNPGGEWAKLGRRHLRHPCACTEQHHFGPGYIDISTTTITLKIITITTITTWQSPPSSLRSH